MAKARMLHKKISTSQDVNKLSLPAKLLFTWMIAHADDEGRMKGDPSWIEVTVVPWTRWSGKNISLYLNEMKDIGLIYYWQIKNEWYIEFPKWKDYQQIRKDRFEPSKLPSFGHQESNPVTTVWQPDDNQATPQCNESESKIELNKGEYKEQSAPTSANSPFKALDPRTYMIKSAAEAAAKDAWIKLEPGNDKAFFTTYLKAVRSGLPSPYFYQFVSEIKQSNTNNPGAVFNTKVKEYLNRK